MQPRRPLNYCLEDRKGSQARTSLPSAEAALIPSPKRVHPGIKDFTLDHRAAEQVARCVIWRRSRRVIAQGAQAHFHSGSSFF